MPYEVFKYPENSQYPNDVAFRGISGKEPTPEERLFAVKINLDCIRLRWLGSKLFNKYTENPVFQECLHLFYGAAQAGLADTVGSIETGGNVLVGARHHVMITMGRKFIGLFLIPVVFICGCLILISIGLLVWRDEISIRVSSVIPELKYSEIYLTSLSVAWLGVSLSVLLSYLWRTRGINWDDLEYLDPSGTPPSVRVLGVTVLVIILMVLLLSNIVIVGLFNTPLNKFISYADSGGAPTISFPLSFLVGAVCGLSESPIIGIVQNVFRPTSQPAQERP
jgi:hypothetical protein